MKEYVIGEPFMTATELNEDDTHLILACDGVCKLPFMSLNL